MSDLSDYLINRFSFETMNTRKLLRRVQQNQAILNEHSIQLLGMTIPGWHDWPDIEALCQRTLEEIEIKRRIVAWHENWPVLVTGPIETESSLDAPDDPPRAVADFSQFTMRISQQMVWLTNREYLERFGPKPATAPILRMLAAPYAQRPDFNQEWLSS